MTELERALVALGNELDIPAAPDLVPRVRARLEERRRRFGRPLAIAFALVVVAFGIAMAVPEARSAILRFFHIGSVTIERVETLPLAPNRPLAAGFGPPLSRSAAERHAGFAIRLPGGVGTPTRYYAQPGMIATVLVYRGRPVLLAELQGDQVFLFKKVAGPGTRVEPAEIGQAAVWLEGGKHVLMWTRGQIETRLAGNVLLWLEGATTYRLEGRLEKGVMLQLARQITR